MMKLVKDGKEYQVLIKGDKIQTGDLRLEGEALLPVYPRSVGMRLVRYLNIGIYARPLDGTGRTIEEREERKLEI